MHGRRYLSESSPCAEKNELELHLIRWLQCWHLEHNYASVSTLTVPVRSLVRKEGDTDVFDMAHCRRTSAQKPEHNLSRQLHYSITSAFFQYKPVAELQENK